MSEAAANVMPVRESQIRLLVIMGYLSFRQIDTMSRQPVAVKTRLHWENPSFRRFNVRSARLPFLGVVLISLVLAGCDSRSPSVTASSQPTNAPSSETRQPNAPGGPTATPPTQLGFPKSLERLGSGQIYLETDGAVLKVDLRARTVQRTLTSRLDRFRDFVATRSFLVVRQVEDGTGYVVAQDGTMGELPNDLAGPGRRVWQGPRGSAWVVPDGPSGGHRMVAQYAGTPTLMTLVGRRSIPQELGIPQTDYAGNLLFNDSPTAYAVTLSSTKRLTGWQRGWEMLGIGRTAVIVRPCQGCKTILLNRSTNDRKKRATSAGLQAVDALVSRFDYGADGQLSPSGRFLAMTFTTNDDEREPRLAVVDLARGRTVVIPGTLTRINSNDQFTWLGQTDDRWLLAVTGQTLRVLDTRTGDIHTWRGQRIDRIAVRRT